MFTHVFAKCIRDVSIKYDTRLLSMLPKVDMEVFCLKIVSEIESLQIFHNYSHLKFIQRLFIYADR